MAKILFLGAVGEITGSCFLIESAGVKVIVDIGMYQGQNAESENYCDFGFEPGSVSAVLLTHAHLDHCGRLPLLVKKGFTGKVYATKPTLDLLSIILLDAAKISANNAVSGALYQDSDVYQSLSQTLPVEYEQTVKVAKGISARWWDAGHILGSASIELILEREQKTIVFSGDLGNQPSPLIKQTVQPNHADFVVMESTYGNRLHPPRGQEEETIANLCQKVAETRGALLIPAFSLERTQEFLYIFDHLKKTRQIADWLPIYLDSPMAFKATAVFEKYPQYFNEQLQAHFRRDDPFDFPGLIFVEKRFQSQALHKKTGAKVIIAGSGMMSGGRMVNHAKKYLSNKNTIVLISGYQAVGTLGREILSKPSQVTIEGLTVPLKAEVVEITSMSGHADREQLISWVGEIKEVKQVFLVHGETESQNAIKTILTTKGLQVEIPDKGESITI